MKNPLLRPNERITLRIIPHRNVKNSGNRNLWRVMHDLLAVRDPFLSRFDRRTFTYRPRPDIWWSIVMRQNAVEFYVTLPKDFGDVFLLKLKNHEQWSSCTVTEAELPPIPKEAEPYAVKFDRADMFSLTVNYAEQTTPIRDTLQTTHELSEGDFAGLYVRLEAVNRRKWKQKADYEWDVWQSGGMPERAGIDPNRIWRTLGLWLTLLFGEVQKLIEDTMDAMEGVFFQGAEKRDRKKEKPINPEREAILVNGSTSTSTNSKRNLPVYRTAIQLAVSAPTPARRAMLAHSMASAFGELAGDNRLHPVPLKIKYLSELGNQLPPKWDWTPNLLSTDEVGRIIQLPTKDVQEEFAHVLEANKAVEVEVPAVFRDESGILAGVAELKGEQYPVHLPKNDLDMLMTARAFIGSPRMGKDQAAINLVVESKRKHGIGAIVLDVIDERGNRGMADALRDHLPPEDVIDLNLGDFDYPVPVSMSSIVSTTNERIASSRLAQELVNFFMGDDLTNHQTREYLREAAKAVNGDLLGIRSMFLDQTFRRERIAELRSKGRDTSLLEDFDQMSDGKQGQIYGPVMVRLGEILGDEALRPIFCQRPKPETDLGKWMAEGKVVIYRVPSRDLGEMAVSTLAHWIVLTVFLTKLARGGPPTWLILNEPHQYLSDGFVHFAKRLLAEGPKYRLAPVFMFHHFKQFHAYPEFVEILLSSSLNWHVFKNTNDGVYQRLKGYLEPTFEPEQAMNATGRFQYIASWLGPNGEYQTPFLANALPLVGDRYEAQDNSFLTKRHSRQFGRSIDEVEREIRQRKAGA